MTSQVLPANKQRATSMMPMNNLAQKYLKNNMFKMSYSPNGDASVAPDVSLNHGEVFVLERVNATNVASMSAVDIIGGAFTALRGGYEALTGSPKVGFFIMSTVSASSGPSVNWNGGYYTAIDLTVAPIDLNAYVLEALTPAGAVVDSGTPVNGVLSDTYLTYRDFVSMLEAQLTAHSFNPNTQTVVLALTNGSTSNALTMTQANASRLDISGLGAHVGAVSEGGRPTSTPFTNQDALNGTAVQSTM